MRKHFLPVCVLVLFFIILLPIQANAAELVATGECGYGLTWTLDSDGVLIVSGQGAMHDWTSSGFDPWMSQRNNIKKAIIQPGVTHIGRFAFYSCQNLTSISIPNSVTSIGENAFSYTGYFNNSGKWENDVLYIDKYLITAQAELSGTYTIKAGTVLLANGAFSGCHILAGITLPNSVKYIGDEAFSDCTNLEEITLPSEITNIGENVFSDTKYYSTETNWENGVLYLGNCLLKAKPELTGSYMIKDGTKSIQYRAFYGCDNLTSIDIPDSVICIGKGAFQNCSSLENVKLSNGLLQIGDYAFYGCSGLNEIAFPEQVTKVGNWAFSSCTGLKSIFIPASVESIGNNAFAYCNKIEEIALSEGLKEIGFMAFSNGALYVKKLTIPSTVESIGSSAFTPCWRLESIEVRAGNTRYHSAGNCLIETEIGMLLYGSSTSVIPDDGSVTSIGDEAFDGRTYLRNLVIPTSVTRIGDYAFFNCSTLKSIEIPSSVTSIGARAFEDCVQLVDISLPDGLAGIGYRAFDGSGFFENEENWENDVLYCGMHLLSARTTLSGAYTVKSGTNVIAGGAFADCTDLTDIKLPDSVISIGSNAFDGCAGLSEIRLPPRISVIEPNTFGSCISLKNVHIPEGVKCIGSRSFEECTALTDIYIPDSVEVIEENAFWLSTNLENVILSDGINSIGDAAFWKCGIKHIVLPNSLTSIGDRVFCNCTRLESVAIPQSVKYIHSLAFLNCSALTDIIYIGTPEQKAEMAIDEEAEIDEDHGVRLKDVFWNYVSTETYYSVSACDCEYGTVLTNQRYYGAGDVCAVTVVPNPGYCLKACFVNGIKINSLTFEVTEETVIFAEFELIKPSMEIIDSGVCSRNEFVTWCLYTDGELVIDGFGEMLNWASQIPWQAQWEKINRVVIRPGVTSIGDYAFYGCSCLTDIEIPMSVVSIGNRAFCDCAGLTSIEIPASVTSIGDEAFCDCSNLASIEIPASVLSIGEEAFANCSSLATIEIPEGVTSIGEEAFAGCSSLTSIEIPVSVTSIGDYAFYDCSNLTSIEIPASLTSIADGMFCYCSRLISVKIPVSVTSIGNNAFDNCSSLTSIEIPLSVTSIGDFAFDNCSSLTSIELPLSVTSIGDYAFYNCSNLTSIEIPPSVTSIGDEAFADCSDMTSIFIPASVTDIGADAFDYCRKLTLYGYPSSAAENYAEVNDIPFKSLADLAVLKAIIDPKNEAAAVVAFVSDEVRTIPIGGQALAAVYAADGRFVGLAEAVVWNHNCYALLDETQLGSAAVTFFVLGDRYAPAYVQLSAVPVI